MYEFLRMWSDPSFSGNYVDTNRYDIIQGKAVEREDYRINRLKEEQKSVESAIKLYEQSLAKYAARLEEINKELEP